MVTPNLDEAAMLLGRAIDAAGQLDAAARDLLALGAPAVLLKGGHLPGAQVVDVLLQAGAPDAPRRWQDARIPSRNTHGTGCTLSAAIACELALGRTLEGAVDHARQFVRQAMAAGADLRVGHGHGPLNHGFAPLPAHRLPL